MGATGSKLEKALGDQFPEGERYFGLENFGNTCYCNSVLQALYFCVPFRDKLLEYHSKSKHSPDMEDNLLTCLADLYNQIISQKRKTGVIAPKKFVQRLRKQNDLFRTYMHQRMRNLSLPGYTRIFSLQEAQKRMKIKKPPNVLVIHLKRFKYIEQIGRYKKLSYRVVFPLEMKLTNTVEDTDTEYSLFAVVVHIGLGPNHGHYVSLVKSHTHWLFFDDENVDMIDEAVVQSFFGSSHEYSNNTDHGYILFYESLAQ